MGTTALDPGDETRVTMVLMMHRGMEGPHLFRITVPVGTTGGSSAQLELYVRADFR